MPLQGPKPEFLGLRLAAARNARDITQQIAAEALGCSRPTLIAIEKGTRRAKPEEIVTLARLYGRSVHELVRPGEPTSDLQPHLRAVAQRIREATGHLKGVRVAVMGCIVNGPGEMADADFGYVGGAPGKINLYVGRDAVKFNIPESEAVDQLVELIREHGKWVEAPVAQAL